MYQPYPTGAQMPVSQRPPVPPSVANAVKVMYVGALTSLLGIVIDVVTVGATKTAIEKRSHNLTMSQITSVQHVLVTSFIIGGVIGAAVWIVLARLCQAGKNGARITGTALFGLATLDTLVGAAVAPVSGLVRIWALVVWLVGLTAVVFLWRRSSTAFFKGAGPS
jgi:nitric oxide reductase large subunit